MIDLWCDSLWGNIGTGRSCHGFSSRCCVFCRISSRPPLNCPSTMANGDSLPSHATFVQHLFNSCERKSHATFEIPFGACTLRCRALSDCALDGGAPAVGLDLVYLSFEIPFRACTPRCRALSDCALDRGAPAVGLDFVYLSFEIPFRACTPRCRALSDCALDRGWILCIYHSKSLSGRAHPAVERSVTAHSTAGHRLLGWRSRVSIFRVWLLESALALGANGLLSSPPPRTAGRVWPPSHTTSVQPLFNSCGIPRNFCSTSKSFSSRGHSAVERPVTARSTAGLPAVGLEVLCLLSIFVVIQSLGPGECACTWRGWFAFRVGVSCPAGALWTGPRDCGRRVLARPRPACHWPAASFRRGACACP